MKFKISVSLAVLSVFLALPLSGCHAVTSSTPPAALAPGYTSTADQTLGESLAAVNYFVNQEKLNYAKLSADQQVTEKPLLNSLVTATNLANAAYTAYHAGTQTLNQAQTAYNSAYDAQTALAAAKGVK